MQFSPIARLAVFGLLVSGCYTLQPVTSPNPVVGTKIALDITDVGRVALGGTIGPEIGQVEGILVEAPGDEYVLAVSQVRFLRGGFQSWTGEQVRIRKEHVGRSYERRLDKGKTVALSAALVGGLVAVVVSRDLLGLGTVDPEPPGGGNGEDLVFRGRRRP